MLIIWRGWGILVPVLTWLTLLLVQLAVDGANGSGTYSNNSLFVAVGLFVAAGVCRVFAFELKSRRKGRQVIDKTTGAEITIKPKDDLFFINVQWWPAILVVISLIVAVAKLVTG